MDTKISSVLCVLVLLGGAYFTYQSLNLGDKNPEVIYGLEYEGLEQLNSQIDGINSGVVNVLASATRNSGTIQKQLTELYKSLSITTDSHRQIDKIRDLQSNVDRQKSIFTLGLIIFQQKRDKMNANQLCNFSRQLIIEPIKNLMHRNKFAEISRKMNELDSPEEKFNYYRKQTELETVPTDISSAYAEFLKKNHGKLYESCQKVDHYDAISNIALTGKSILADDIRKKYYESALKIAKMKDANPTTLSLIEYSLEKLR